MNKPVIIFGIHVFTFAIFIQQCIVFASAGIDCEFELFKSETIACFNPGLGAISLRSPKDFSENISWTNVESLVLAGTGVVDLEASAFTELSNLKYVDLSRNKIKILKKDFFGHLANIVSLNASSNMISHIEKGAFEGVSSLRELDLSYNFLHHIALRDSSLYALVSLQYLYLSGNEGLKITNSSIPVSVVKLDLSGNISVDQNAFESLKNLKILLMADSKEFKIFDFKFFKDCFAMRSLDLSSSMLSSTSLIYDSFWNMTNLISLNLSKNSLRNFDDKRIFGNNTRLKLLDLSHNMINSFSGDLFKKNSQLVSLFLSNNMLRHLPKKFFKSLINLERLDLSNNQLTTLSGLFTKNLALIKLSASNNLIKEISPYTFQHTIFLNDLHLDGNELTSFPLQNIETLNKLEVLNLNGNHLMVVPNLLRSSGVPFHLMMSCNRISFLPRYFFDLLSSDAPHKMDIRGNPFRCSCLWRALQQAELKNVTFSRSFFTDGTAPICIHDGSVDCEERMFSDSKLKKWKENLNYYYPKACL